MTQVRDLRADVPVPDRGRLAPGRARLVGAARRGQGPLMVWGRRKLVIAAVVAAVTTVGVTASVLAEGSDSGRKVKPAASPSMSLKGLSAAELLERAADVAEHGPPVTPPRADQWIYIKTREEARGGNAKVMAPVSEEWNRYDGTETAVEQRDAEGKNPKLRTGRTNLENDGQGGEQSPREMYRFLAALPTDGKQALRTIHDTYADEGTKGAAGTQQDYAAISALLGAPLTPPDGLAGLYRALALLPGGQVVDHQVKTAAGRRVIALRYESLERKGPTNEWLLDPRTYRIVGLRMLDGDNRVVMGNSVMTTAVVDEAGQRG
ncbi:CU044_5270 family protein [Streptomyces phaeochromogenes]|uniref:CU044_5270 family protein n=1 Tax=Streptomyces phaeochromogenes TaxID=1923 RepID=UPI0033F3347C